MAGLLFVFCPNCAYTQCAASPLIREALISMKEENEAEFQRLISMEMLFVFCQKTRKFRVIDILG